MKKWSQDKKGSECNIYITQPRRISALTLAKRVADERSEEVYIYINNFIIRNFINKNMQEIILFLISS